MSAPQLREEDGFTFVLLDGELDRLSVHSDGSSQGEFSFEEVARGLSSPTSLDDNEFVRSDSMDKLPPPEPEPALTTAPQQPKHQKKGKRASHRAKPTSTEWRAVVPQGVKPPTNRDPPPMPLKQHKTYTMEFSTEYDIVGSEKGDANIIYFALEDTGKLSGLSAVFKSYKFMRVVANFSRTYDGPLNGNIYTTLLHKDSKVPTPANIPQMKADNTCMEVTMAKAPQFTRSITPRFTTHSSKAINEWLPIQQTSNATWFGIKYITDPTPATSSLYLVSLTYTIAFRA